MGLGMVLGHYIKRELETLFVHRFSNDTMPFTNLFKNCGHYWVIFGFTLYFFLHPQYSPPKWADQTIYMILCAAFIFFEFMNFLCHVTLRNLRKPGETTRGIPHGFGFGLVSSANYFWESLCWLMFAV